MHKLGRKALSAILTFALLAGLLPTAALAAGDTYTYLDDKGQPQTCTTATVVESSNKEHIEVDWSDTEGNNGWYVVTGSVSISGRIVVTGEVHLILADSCTLNAQQGINVSTGNSLTIYGQSKGTGALTANVPAGELVAAIGGGYDPLNSYDGEDCGTVTINGGHVTATGAENGYGAGIGGGGGGDVGGAGGTFSTGTGGSAGIFAQGGENAAAISDTSGQENWQGVIFQGNAGQVYGGVTLSDDVEIPAGYTLTIPSGTSLTVPEGKTLTNNGTITGDGSLTGEGTLINNGTVSVLNNDFMATVEVSISPSPATYNSSVSLTAMVTDGSEQINSGTVKFYQGEINAANELNSDSVNVTSGTATYTIATVDWMPGSYTITAVYTPVEDSDLLESSGTAQLTVNKAEQKAPSAPTLSGKTSTSIMLNEITTTGQGNVQYACVEGKNRTAPTGDESWQTSTTFDRLKPGTDYTCFARYAGNDCYEPSPASSPGLTATTERADSTLTVEPSNTTLTYGETLTITVTPEQTADTNTLNTLEDTVELYIGNKLLVANAGQDPYTLIYDTKEQDLSIGKNTLTVSYGGSDSLNPSTAEVTVMLEKANVNAVLNGTTSKTYDGTTNAPEGLSIALTGVLDGDKVTASSSSISYDSANVGDNKTITASNITLTGADAAYYALMSDKATVQTGFITPAEQDALTISGLPDKVYVGDQFTLTASGGTGDGALTWKVVSGSAEIDASTGAVRVTGEGEIKIRVTKAEDATHNAASAEITFTANEIPYTGKYSYEISTDIGDNGALNVDRYATEGERVTITVSPDDAYKLDDLSVTAHGKEVEVTANGDGTFSFTMPSADVKIRATFAEDPDWTEPEEPATDVSDLFIDVAPNAWYKDAVQYAYDNGLMTGVSANEFAPEQTTTRAMIVSILARLENVTSAESAGFNDVNDEWYATAVNWAANVGVVNGYEDNTFRPNQPITREQLAAILMNYASYKGEDVSARADLSNYTDQPSAWATETMQWAVAEGLISGVTADQLQPQGNATRAQVAAILERFLAQ